ncbi:MAG: acyltransferase [Thermodesulfobacteriota bacterium]|nr:acyltransferase [Thermodesulfobacteriota bacterium]
MFLRDLSLKIRRRETPFYDRLYQIAKSIRSINMPVIKPVHFLLYWERELRLSSWHSLKQFLYYEPLFKSRCEKVGKGLKLFVGIPQIVGDLRLIVGNNVTLHGVSTFSGVKIFDKPTLTIGDNTHLGYQVGITVGCDIQIGSNVLIGNRVGIFSYDLHPLDPAERIANKPAPKESSKPILIEDNVWIASNSVILKGVTIGRGSVVANSSVVTRNVPPHVVVAGNPARIVKDLDEAVS